MLYIGTNLFQQARVKVKNFILHFRLFFILFVTLFCQSNENYWQNSTFESFKDSKQTFSLSSLPFETSISIINFFAPDCPPCIEELPTIAKLSEKYIQSRKINFTIIGSNLLAVAENKSIGEIKEAIEKFKKQHNIQYNIFLASSNDLKNFKVTGFPETLIFKRSKNNQWQLVRKFISSIEESDIDPYL